MAKIINKIIQAKNLVNLKDNFFENLLPSNEGTLSYFVNDGLYFYVTSKGKKSWVLRYEYMDSGKKNRSLYRLGDFPVTSLLYYKHGI